MRSLPSPRGRVSELLLSRLLDDPGPVPRLAPSPGEDPLSDEDLQLALYLCYELHYRGLPGVDEGWEWEPSLLALRRSLEDPFERALFEAVPRIAEDVPAAEIDIALRAIAEEDGPSLSSYVKVSASLDEVREFVAGFGQALPRLVRAVDELLARADFPRVT